MSFSAERYSGLASFRSALRKFLAASKEICEKGGITTAQYQAMLVLGCSSEPLSMKRLAEQKLLKHHSVVQMVDRLSRAGLVERIASQHDRRVALVVLTTKGESKLEKLAEQHLAEVLKQEPLLSSSLRKIKNRGEGQ
jgi:DNA-binding MarR family transcriptional regulator